jgi:hypothetical protein
VRPNARLGDDGDDRDLAAIRRQLALLILGVLILLAGLALLWAEVI